MNYLAVPDLPLNGGGKSFDTPGGTIFDGDLGTVREIKSFDDSYFRDNVSESIARAWCDGDWDRPPWQEETIPRCGEYDPHDTYSWVKAPRFQGRPIQVGPLVQVLVGYALGHTPIKRWTNWVLETAGSLAQAKLSPAILHSTLGRHAARGIRAAVMSELALKHWELLVEKIGTGDAEIFTPWEYPKGEVRGFGFHEAPRGTLPHWIVIRDGKIANYQAVVPSTRNAGPRDGKGHKGPYEASLVGNPVADPEKPLEVLRTVHSFDPCLARATHALDPGGRELSRIRTL